MQRSLANSSIECAKLLDTVSSLLHDPKCEERSALVHDEIEDQSDRFSIWAGSLGAFQRLPATSSLDHRLRESPKLAAQVQELLQDLKDALQNVLEIASGERPNRQYEADDDNDDEFDVEEDEDDDLYHNATDSIEDHERGDGQVYLSEGQELLKSVRETIASLFRISMVIRNASPRDRFARALLSKQTQFDDCFDISHVSHKFPLLNTKENQWLRRRLGKAITHRRQFLRYARDHRDKLSKKPTDLWEPEDQEKRSTPVLIVNWGEKSQAERTNFTKPISTLAPTTASTLRLLDMQIHEKGFQDDQSQTSYAFSLDDDDESHLQLPRLSDVAKGTFPFECPLCWTIQNITRESSWRKHAFSDLRPYVCTFEKCDVKLFSNRHDWFDHEMQNHRIQWYCHFCKKDGFRSLERFQKHLCHYHAQDATDDQLHALCEASRRPIDRIPASDCPFCDEWETKLRQVNSDVTDNKVVVLNPSEFRDHVGSHMQQLALFALPRGYLEDDAKLGSTASREVAGIEKGEPSRGHSSLSSFKSVGSIAPSSVTAEELNRRALEEYGETPGKEHPYTLSELQMLQLTGAKGCQFCGKQNSFTPGEKIWQKGPGATGVRTIWPFGIRACGPCLLERSQTDASLLFSGASPLRPALPFAFITDDHNYIPAYTLREATAPAGVKIAKYYYKPHVEEIAKELENVLTLGLAAAEEWSRGLDERGKYRMKAAENWEQWETKEILDRKWEESQRPIRDKLNAFADEYINQDWAQGRAVTYENSPKFAADLLVYVRRMFYADIAKDEGVSPHAQQPLGFANGPESHRPKLVLENMKWVYYNKLKPLTEQFRKELFVCYGNGCEGNTRFYGFEGVIQHFGAKHTNAFSVGNVVVAWREAEWPEETPFHPDPISVKHSLLLASGSSVLSSDADASRASRAESWEKATDRSQRRLDAAE